MSRRARRGAGRGGAGVLLLLVVALGWWAWQERQERQAGSGPAGAVRPGPPGAFVRTAEEARAAAPDRVARQGGYDRYPGCLLIDHRNNDGDSFHVRLPDGREAEFRLHFVDTPESRLKRYRGGETNEERIRHQADYFGVSTERAVVLGAAAKEQVLERLAAGPFTLFTDWRPVFSSGRFYCFVRLTDGDWLDEWLVDRGLARIYTEGARLPDATSEADHESRLRALEARARRAGRGGWAR